MWVADITYIRLPETFVYVAVLMDVYTRRIRGRHLSRHLDQSLSLTALQRALVQHRPEMHHSDQGIQYALTLYTRTLQALAVQISMATVGEAADNGYTERLNRTIKEEEVRLHDYVDFRAAYQHMGRFLDDVYQHKRIHSASGYLTPAEFKTQGLEQYGMAMSAQFETP